MWQFLVIIAIAFGATGMIVWAIRGVSKDREAWREEYPRLAESGQDDHPPGDPGRRSVAWSWDPLMIVRFATTCGSM